MDCVWSCLLLPTMQYNAERENEGKMPQNSFIEGDHLYSFRYMWKVICQEGGKAAYSETAPINLGFSKYDSK